MRKQRISPQFARAHRSVRHTNSLLPNRTGVRYLEDLGRRRKKAIQIGEINVGADMISTDVVHGKSRRQIDFSRDGLARFQMKSGLRDILGKRSDEMVFACIDLKTDPVLAFFIVEIDVAACEI